MHPRKDKKICNLPKNADRKFNEIREKKIP
jgi:hypothetical protein